MNATCAQCQAPISLPGDQCPRTCTDVDPAKTCRAELRKSQASKRQLAEGREKGRIVTCEWADCGHTWRLRGYDISYCRKCGRTPPGSGTRRIGVKGLRTSKTPIPNEFPYCHNCGAPKATTRVSCRACMLMNPTSIRRFGLSVKNWNKFLATLARAAETDRQLSRIVEVIGIVMKTDPESRILEEALADGPELSPPIISTGDIASADDGPDEVELPVEEALGLVRSLFGSTRGFQYAPSPALQYDPKADCPDV